MPEGWDEAGPGRRDTQEEKSVRRELRREGGLFQHLQHPHPYLPVHRAARRTGAGPPGDRQGGAGGRVAGGVPGGGRVQGGRPTGRRAAVQPGPAFCL